MTFFRKKIYILQPYKTEGHACEQFFSGGQRICSFFHNYTACSITTADLKLTTQLYSFLHNHIRPQANHPIIQLNSSITTSGLKLTSQLYRFLHNHIIGFKLTTQLYSFLHNHIRSQANYPIIQLPP